jgi:hypothetical protein
MGEKKRFRNIYGFACSETSDYEKVISVIPPVCMSGYVPHYRMKSLTNFTHIWYMGWMARVRFLADTGDCIPKQKCIEDTVRKTRACALETQT